MVNLLLAINLQTLLAVYSSNTANNHRNSALALTRKNTFRRQSINYICNEITYSEMVNKIIINNNTVDVATENNYR